MAQRPRQNSPGPIWIGPRAQIEGPALFLNANAVQNLGFAFHELATNASKHGALTSSQGRVLVTGVARKPMASSGWSGLNEMVRLCNIRSIKGLVLS